jgi:hypothetical protein
VQQRPDEHTVQQDSSCQHLLCFASVLQLKVSIYSVCSVCWLSATKVGALLPDTQRSAYAIADHTACYVLCASVDTIHCVRVCSALCCIRIWLLPISMSCNYYAVHVSCYTCYTSAWRHQQLEPVLNGTINVNKVVHLVTTLLTIGCTVELPSTVKQDGAALQQGRHSVYSRVYTGRHRHGR